MTEIIDKKVKDWLEGAKEEEIIRPVLPYEEKLVAFIDVLGVTDKVTKSGDDAEQIVNLMRELRTYVQTECDILFKQDRLNSVQIGDGFIIVSKPDCINEICKILSLVQWQVLIYSHMLLRGALTAGKVAIGDNQEYIIGPAIIEAFALERYNAIYPRIIYENKKIAKYAKNGDFVSKYIVEDQDKIQYIDYLQYNVDNEKLEVEELKQLLTKQEVNKELKEKYESLICTDKSAAQKYGWLISKFAICGVKII